MHLQRTRGNNGRTLVVLNRATLGTGGFKSLNDVQGLLVSNLAEDDVTAVEPRGDNGGDEELGTVGVGTGVGHGKQTGAVVLQLEVLISELLAIDGLATSAVATGEVTTLEHEFRDDSVERRTGITEALLASAESTEVLGSLGNNVGEEVELDAARLRLHGTGRAAVLQNGTLPLNVEVDLGRHDCGC